MDYSEFKCKWIKVTKMAEAKEYRESLSLRAVQSGTTQKAEKEIKEDAKFPETLIQWAEL